MLRFIIYTLIFLFLNEGLYSQTIGVTYKSQGATDDLYLISPLNTHSTYLIDNCGFIYNEWYSQFEAASASYLDSSGALYRAGKKINSKFNFGGGSGIIEKFNSDGELLWTFELSNDSLQMHHDFEVLENGNLLIIVWQYISNEEIIGLGRNPNAVEQNGFYSDVIYEINPNDSFDIVWEWKAIDHIVQDFDSTLSNFGSINDNPQLIDLNLNVSSVQQSIDWLHVNSIDYNLDLSQIVISCNGINEILIIDYNKENVDSTQNEIRYRWGAIQNYKEEGQQQLFKQHDATWIFDPNSGKYNLLIFNNGQISIDGDRYSSIDEIILPYFQSEYEMVNGDDDLDAFYAWRYNHDGSNDLYSKRMSSVRKNNNGHVLVCESDNGRLIEVDRDGNVLWQYINPVNTNGVMTQGDIPFGNTLFSVDIYAKEDLSEIYQNTFIKIEFDSNSACKEISTDVTLVEEEKLEVYFRGDKLYGFNLAYDKALVYDRVGKLITSIDIFKNDFCINFSGREQGIYFVNLIAFDNQTIKTLKLEYLQYD